ncbi:hypothetical protein BuS5_02767 [Desulfosarcina sp. BuS5]|uniref:aldehyde dehydrogenase family protein n=1 Tax=Desulfosarcina sp. BuS5 TaxID=933262 RepID=UPI000486B7C6|nr:aldehyde dehydrogenase family protein [Desulfosarcina sp. BuS5]WDN89799.1 hypothetical protein BuS5_02767 [Desulfosarcina sp. BuS5]
MASPYQRIKIFKKAVELIKKRSPELAKTAALEGGKPVVDSKIEIDRAVNGIKVAIQDVLSL